MEVKSEDLEKLKKILDNHEKRIKELENSKVERKKNTKEKADSVLGFLVGLKEEGFFDQPRFLNEIIAELGRKGHRFKAAKVAKSLLHAVQQNKLGRIGKVRKWQYVKR